MIRLILLLAGALMGVLVAIEAANFAIHNLALKSLPRLSEHAGVIEFRVWAAIATASLAWIAAVRLTALSFREIRARRHK